MIIAISLSGTLRLRKIGKNKGVVELRSHLYPGDWIYCVYRSLPYEEAFELFQNQSYHYCDKNMWTSPVVQPGV